MSIGFPSSPANNDKFTTNGRDYIYNATAGRWDIETPVDFIVDGTPSYAITSFTEIGNTELNVGPVGANIRSLWFKPDGTAMYVLEGAGTDWDVLHYTLSTAWDVSTKSYTGGLASPSSGSDVTTMSWDVNGEYVYDLDRSGETIRRRGPYSTPWQVSSFSGTSVTDLTIPNGGASFYTGMGAGAFGGMAWKPDGTKLYITAWTNSTTPCIAEFNLSTPWDILTLTYVNRINFTGNKADGVSYRLRINSTGTRLLLLKSESNNLVTWYDHDFNTAWSTSAGITEVGTGLFHNVPSSGFFHNEEKFFSVYYSTGAGAFYTGRWDSNAGSYDGGQTITTQAAPTESLTDISQLTDSGNVLDAAGRISTVITSTAGLNGIATPAAGRLAYEDTADRMYVYNGTGWRILHDENNPQFQPFDLIATGTDGDSFSSSTQYVFNDDGTEVTAMGGGNTLSTYALDTAYDVFNVSSRSSLRNKTIPGHAYAFVYGIAFNGDGTKIFITDAEDGGTSGREINTFTLSTAYDISTMSASATATDNLYTASGGASGEVEGLHFNTNGTRMFTWDQNGRRLIQWNLSSAYTPSSASIVTALTLRTVIENSGHSGNASSIFSGNFNADGTRLYVADWTGVVYLIRLSTGFDLSTATHTQGEFFDLTSYAEYPQGITLNADETVLTVRAQGLSPATGNLYQFLVPST